ncbi:helix-turn-helix domain-containing protein [Microbacterium sp. NPDC089696]|uniref:helix-turn-helix domain-containing protein n=1 Tax=Microbacterium sp. NPDC089696 TaxID=3364199 RepID=UPI0038113017
MWGPEAAERFGGVVRALRKESGLTQEMLAARVGITKNQLQLIEAGRSASSKNTEAGPSNPRMTTVVGIASAFDLSVEQLMAESRL